MLLLEGDPLEGDNPVAVAEGGRSGRCSHGFVEYVEANTAAAAGRGNIRPAFQLSIAGRKDMGRHFR